MAFTFKGLAGCRFPRFGHVCWGNRPIFRERTAPGGAGRGREQSLAHPAPRIRTDGRSVAAGGDWKPHAVALVGARCAGPEGGRCSRDGRGKRSGGADRRLGPRLVRRCQVLIVLGAGAGASAGVSQAVGRMGVVKRFGDHRVGHQGRTAPAASAAITAGEMRRPGGWLIMSSCLGFVWSSLRRPRPGAGGSGWMGRSSGWRTRCGTWRSFCVGWGWKWSRPR